MMHVTRPRCSYAVSYTHLDVYKRQVLRYKGHGQQDADGARTIQTLAQWLLDHKDDDNDGIYGWGLIRSTRTFGREATNPAFHEYAIEIVQVLEALMNAADTNALSQKTKDEIRELAVELAVQWSTPVSYTHLPSVFSAPRFITLLRA